MADPPPPQYMSGKYVLWWNWLIEYNCSLLANHLFKGRDKVKSGFNKPHQSLGYLTPMEVLHQKMGGKLSPLYPTCTKI